MTVGGQVALITGGASGFGEQVARRLVARGDAVVLLDVDEDNGQRVAKELGMQFLRCDVSSYEDVMTTTEQAEQVFGGLDLIFLNAGVSTGCGIDEDFDLSKYRRAMGVNLDGVVFGVHAALPVLRRRGGGSIVATASMAGLAGIPSDPSYGANKHAVVGLVRSLGPLLAAQNIRVNAFCPGFAETAIIGPIREVLLRGGMPIIGIAEAGDAVLQAFDSTETGQAWLLQAGRPVVRYQFRGIPGPLRPDGSRPEPMDQTSIPTGMA